MWVNLLIHSQTSTVPLLKFLDKWFRPTHFYRCNNLSMLRLKLIYVRKRATKICLNKLQKLLTLPLVKCWIIETEWCIYASVEQAIIGSDNGFIPLVGTVMTTDLLLFSSTRAFNVFICWTMEKIQDGQWYLVNSVNTWCVQAARMGYRVVMLLGNLARISIGFLGGSSQTLR